MTTARDFYKKYYNVSDRDLEYKSYDAKKEIKFAEEYYKLRREENRHLN